MNITIQEQKESPLLSRKEVSADMTFSGPTPSNAEVQKQIASQVKVDADKVVIKKIKMDYGNTTATIHAYVYDTVEALKTIEPKSKKEEVAEGQPQAEAPAAPAEEKKEAAPATEEPKEEKAE